MIIFYSIINLFISIFVLCYTHDVMGDYIYEVLRCNAPITVVTSDNIIPATTSTTITATTTSAGTTIPTSAMQLDKWVKNLLGVHCWPMDPILI